MDFLLTPMGDISFEVHEAISNPFEVSFITAKSNTLRIKFHTDDSTKTSLSKSSSLTINFSTYVPTNNKAITLTTSDEYYEQQIRIRLQTAFGNMGSYPTLGSYLEKYKHKFIDTCTPSSELPDEIKRCLKDIIPDCEVTIGLKQNKYYGYSNCLEISIYDNTRKKEYNYQL